MLLWIVLIASISSTNSRDGGVQEFVLTDNGINIFKMYHVIDEKELYKINSIEVLKEENKDSGGYIYRILCEKQECFRIETQDNIIETIIVTNKIKTNKGIRCGSTIKEAKKKYGQGKILRFNEDYFIKFNSSSIWFKLNESQIPARNKIPPQDFDEMIRGAIKKEYLDKLKAILNIDSIKIVSMELWYDI
jgi:hypothetical protein